MAYTCKKFDMNPICSNKHFERLLISFGKIAEKQMGNNRHIERNAKLFSEFLDGKPQEFSPSPFDYLRHDLLNKFKRNPYKTHSCLDDVMFSEINHKFWISYTVEDENKQRTRTKNFSGKFLVFKVYLRIGNYRKNRIVRWSIPITWHNTIN